MEVSDMESFEREDVWEHSDGMMKWFRSKPIEKKAHGYGYDGMPTGKRKNSIDMHEEHDKQRLECEKLLRELEDKKEESQKLYEYYKTENEAQRKSFSRRLKSQAFDCIGCILGDPLKIETWYFLTKEEARLHIQFDKYLESCPFIVSGSSPDTVIKNLRSDENSKLQIFESLPEDLIMSSVWRKINQFNKLKEQQIFLEFLKYLVEHDYRKWGSSMSQLLSRLRREKEFPGLDSLDDNVLIEGLSGYLSFFIGLRDSFNPDIRKSAKKDHEQYVCVCGDRRRTRMVESWEIKKKDGLIYYSAFKELQMESAKHAIENLEIMECLDVSRLIGNASSQIRRESSKHSEWAVVGHTRMQHPKTIMEWMDKMKSEIEESDCEIQRIRGCIIDLGNLLIEENKDSPHDIVEVNDIEDINEDDARKSHYDSLKAAATQHLEFEEYLHSCSFRQDESSSAIYAKLDMQKYTLVPRDLALSRIEGRINRLKILDQHDRFACFVEELVDYDPHIKFSDDEGKTYERLRTDGRLPHLPDYAIQDGLRFFHNVLFVEENPYDPRIRKGHKDHLLWIINKRCKIDRRNLMKQWEWKPINDHSVYDEVLKEKIAKKHSSEAYKSAKQSVLLHKNFELHLASSEFVKFDSSREEILEEYKMLIPNEYSVLPRNLIEESIDVRIRILKKMHEFDRFTEFMKHLIQHNYKKFGSNLEELLKNSKWDKFSDLPEHYIIQGFMIYIQFSSLRSEDLLRQVDRDFKLERWSMLRRLERTKYYDDWIYELASD